MTESLHSHILPVLSVHDEAFLFLLFLTHESSSVITVQAVVNVAVQFNPTQHRECMEKVVAAKRQRHAANVMSSRSHFKLLRYVHVV